MTPWKLPLIVLALLVLVVGAFYFGGPGAGVGMGSLLALGLVAAAARARPRGGIGGRADDDGERRVLVVVSRAVEDPAATAAVAEEVQGSGGRQAEAMVLAPARIGFLDRWASDLEGARREAQEALVISVASLAKMGIAAEARVGDEDIVQAVEDQVGSFAATEVVLVTAPDAADPGAAAAARELSGRLRPGFRRIVVNDPGAR